MNKVAPNAAHVLSRSPSQSSVRSTTQAAQTPPSSQTSSPPSSPVTPQSPARNDAFQANGAREQELNQLRDQKLVSSLTKTKGPQSTLPSVKIGVPIRADGNGGGHTYDLHSIKNIKPPPGTGIQPQALPPSSEHGQVPASLEEKATLPANLNDLRASSNPKEALNGVHGLYIPGAPTANNTQVKAERSGAPSDAKLNRVPENSTKPSDIFKKAEHDSRSEYELKLLNEAQNRGMPTMGVCAGSWRVLESYGGQVETLPKDERSKHKASNSAETWTLNHDVETTPGSMLQSMTKSTSIPGVNSTHWAAAQTVNDANGRETLAPNPNAKQPDGTRKNPNTLLEVSAKATGNQAGPFQHQTVEAFESKHGAPVMGVQWHPESYQPGMPGENGDKPAVDSGRKIMQAFGEAAQTYQRKQEVLGEIKQRVPKRPPTTE